MSGSNSNPRRPERPSPAAIRTFLARAIRAQAPDLPPEDLEDLVHEAYLKVEEAFDRLAVDSYEGLMTTIGRRTLYNFHRRVQLWKRQEDQAARNHGRWGYRPGQFWTPIENVEFVIVEFFEENRTICALIARRIFSGLNLREIAEEIGKSHAATRKQWERCLEFLRAAVLRQERALIVLREWIKSQRREP